MNILITGAGGFIGKHLISFLSKKHNIIAVSRSVNNPVKNNYEVDLRNKDQVISFAEQLSLYGRIDAILHLASRFITDGETDDLSVLYDNIKITENLVLLVKELKVKKLINFSTIAVYPNISGEFKETFTVSTSKNTECIYGLSKICSEKLFDYLLRDISVSILHLRLSQVYGNGMREDRIIPIMLKELKEFNRITLLGEGKRISNFINIKKVTQFVSMFLKNDTKGIYNIGDKNQSYLDLAKRLIKDCGDQGSIIVKKNEGSRSKFILNISKLKKFINKNNKYD